MDGGGMYLCVDGWAEGKIDGARTGGLTDVYVGGELGWLDGVFLWIDKKVSQSRYRPEVAQRVPES
jgi:hypothetical protein